MLTERDSGGLQLHFRRQYDIPVGYPLKIEMTRLLLQCLSCNKGLLFFPFVPFP